MNDTHFFDSRETALRKKLKKFTTKKSLKQHLRDTYKTKDGIANRFVTWHESLLPVLEVMVDKVVLIGLKKVLIEMSKNMKENSAGFPDLFIWTDKKYQFYEVKSPNDQLSAQQLFWINFLEQSKINIDVLRVNYLDQD